MQYCAKLPRDRICSWSLGPGQTRDSSLLSALRAVENICRKLPWSRYACLEMELDVDT